MVNYDVKGNLKEVIDSLPQHVKLVAVSKYHPNEYILQAYSVVDLFVCHNLISYYLFLMQRY